MGAVLNKLHLGSLPLTETANLSGLNDGARERCARIALPKCFELGKKSCLVVVRDCIDQETVSLAEKAGMEYSFVLARICNDHTSEVQRYRRDWVSLSLSAHGLFVASDKLDVDRNTSSGKEKYSIWPRQSNIFHASFNLRQDKLWLDFHTQRMKEV